MPQFEIDEDVVALVKHLAKPTDFETFSSALRRILQSSTQGNLDDLFAEAMAATSRAQTKKTRSPSATEWTRMVSELRSKKGLNSWKAICDALKIETAGDSARRKLKNWVKANRPSWPAVPDID